MTKLEKQLDDAVANYEAVAWEHRGFGAADTEPNWVFKDLMVKALHGKAPLPRSGDDWQLYTYSMKCGPAVKALNKAAKVVRDLIVKHSDSRVMFDRVHYHTD